MVSAVLLSAAALAACGDGRSESDDVDVVPLSEVPAASDVPPGTTTVPVATTTTAPAGDSAPTSSSTTTVEPVGTESDVPVLALQLEAVTTIPVAALGFGSGPDEITPQGDGGRVHAAVLPDSIIVLEASPPDGLLTGKAIVIDRTSGLVRGSVQLDGSDDGEPFWTAGGPDGTLYVATYHADVPQVRVRALREQEPGTFAVVDTGERELLGDGELMLTERGVEIGGDVVIATSSGDERPSVAVELVESTPSAWRYAITRLDPDGSSQSWDLEVEQDSSFPPPFDVPLARAFRDGVLFSTLTSGDPGAPLPIAYLAGPGEAGGAWALNDGWQVVDLDENDALLARLTVAGLELAWLQV